MIIKLHKKFARLKLHEAKLFFGSIDLTVLDEEGQIAVQNIYSEICTLINLVAEKQK